MNKQTTLEEFEKGMTENLSYLQRNTKEGKYVWTKSHVCNPERSFSRSWKMTLCMWSEEGYVKEATFSLTYDLSLQYAGDMEARLESPRRLPESPCIGMVCLSPLSKVLTSPPRYFSTRSNKSWDWRRSSSVDSGS